MHQSSLEISQCGNKKEVDQVDLRLSFAVAYSTLTISAWLLILALRHPHKESPRCCVKIPTQAGQWCDRGERLWKCAAAVGLYHIGFRLERLILKETSWASAQDGYRLTSGRTYPRHKSTWTPPFHSLQDASFGIPFYGVPLVACLNVVNRFAQLLAGCEGLFWRSASTTGLQADWSYRCEVQRPSMVNDCRKAWFWCCVAKRCIAQEMADAMCQMLKAHGHDKADETDVSRGFFFSEVFWGRFPRSLLWDFCDELGATVQDNTEKFGPINKAELSPSPLELNWKEGHCGEDCDARSSCFAACPTWCCIQFSLQAGRLAWDRMSVHQILMQASRQPNAKSCRKLCTSANRKA